MKKVLLLFSFIFEVTLFGDFIMYDDFNGQTLDMDKWDTLAWAGGQVPLIDSNKALLSGSQNSDTNIQGTLKDEYIAVYDSDELTDSGTDSHSILLFKDANFQNVHGVEFELFISSTFQNVGTGVGFVCYDDYLYSYGFFIDAWISSYDGKLKLEFGIAGDEVLADESRFIHISDDWGYLDFIEIQYDTLYKLAYIVKDDTLYFYLDGVEIGQIAYDSSRPHTVSVFRGMNEFAEDFGGYIDNVKIFREFFDSDGDGLHDEDETNTGVFISNRNTGTDPNNPDTSGDGLKDGEVVNSGFDPTVDYTGLINIIRQGIQDLRPGSSLVEVSNNQATIRLEMEQSSAFVTWTKTGDTTNMTVPADTDTKFFRFKMAD